MASLTHTILSKSDQLNADDLLTGPAVAKIEAVIVTNNEQQPVIIKLSGGYRPWKPCKTERRILVYAWGEEGDAYVGRTVHLIRDDNVRFGRDKVGGVRIYAMSHLAEKVDKYLSVSRGKKEPRIVYPLEKGAVQTTDPFRQTLIEATKRAEDPWTLIQIKEWLLGGRSAADVPSYERAAILQRLEGPPSAPEEPEI